jgi:hypothetical protein
MAQVLFPSRPNGADVGKTKRGKGTKSMLLTVKVFRWEFSWKASEHRHLR